MRIEEKLIDLKSKIEKTESEIQRNEGRLSGLYDELKELLGEPNDTKKSHKALRVKAQKELQKLKTDIKEQETEIQKLMTHIENEMEGWDAGV